MPLNMDSFPRKKEPDEMTSSKVSEQTGMTQLPQKAEPALPPNLPEVRTTLATASYCPPLLPEHPWP